MNKIFLVIDRFEGDFAVCEVSDTLTFINVLKLLIPPNSKECDVLIFSSNNDFCESLKNSTNKKIVSFPMHSTLILDKNLTNERKKEVTKKLKHISLLE